MSGRNLLAVPQQPSDRRSLGLAMAVAVLATSLVCTSACTSMSGPGAKPFEDCFQGGKAALEKGQMDKARTLLEQAVQRNPRHPYPHFYLGVVYSETGQLELAIVAFQRAIDLEPNLPEAFFNMGTIHLQRRELTEAIESLERAIELRPDHVPTYNNLGKAYFMAGLAEMAGAAYEEALARDPRDQVALESLMLLARAAGDTTAEQEYRARLAESR